MRQGDRGQRILEFIEDYSESNGHPPTIREIADGVGLKSPATVQGHLQRLQRYGCLTYSVGKTRTVQVIQ